MISFQQLGPSSKPKKSNKEKHSFSYSFIFLFYRFLWHSCDSITSDHIPTFPSLNFPPKFRQIPQSFEEICAKECFQVMKVLPSEGAVSVKQNPNLYYFNHHFVAYNVAV